ncbi:MAG: DUF559 domain-containing protein [Bilophila sp.]
MGTIVFLLFVLGVILYWKKNKQAKNRSITGHNTPALPSSQPQKQVTASTCAKCNPYEPCSVLEEYFCKNILKQSKAKECFQGQYWVQSERGTYRLDFGILPPDATPIAVEIDGYEPHAESITRKNFDRQLSRQNQLNLHGWKVLRFSVDQIREYPRKCIEEIDNALKDVCTTGVHKDKNTLPTEYIEFRYVKKEFRPYLEKIGAKYSEFRNAWHLPFGSTPEELHALPAELQPIIWRACRYCEGEAVQRTRKDDGRKFWSCQTCNKTFNDL